MSSDKQTDLATGWFIAGIAIRLFLFVFLISLYTSFEKLFKFGDLQQQKYRQFFDGLQNEYITFESLCMYTHKLIQISLSLSCFHSKWLDL